MASLLAIMLIKMLMKAINYAEYSILFSEMFDLWPNDQEFGKETQKFQSVILWVYSR